MSAEALRQVTIEKINRAIEDEIQALTTIHDQPLDVVRLVQGRIAGLKMAVEIQDEAYRRIG